MAYTTIDKPTDYFNTVLYTGNSGSNRGITGVGFQPDWVWLKTRSKANSHILIDSVRGQERLRSNTTGGEVDVSSEFISFDTDGFTVTENAANEMNNNSTTYANWNWKAGTNGSGTTTGSGTGKAYSYSVSTDAGFSIVKYIGNGTAGHTIPHHLGAAPTFRIGKTISGSGDNWTVYVEALGNTKELKLNTTAAVGTTTNYWNSTSPSSTVFTLGTNGVANGNDVTFISYNFAPKKGYSKFGSYTGNGNADGTFVYTGFKPAWVMWKRTDATNDWYIYDNKRNSFNTMGRRLEANRSDDEVNSGSAIVDFVSNGYKFRGTDPSWNVSGGTFIYMAFAEESFVSSSGVPATAR